MTCTGVCYAKGAETMTNLHLLKRQSSSKILKVFVIGKDRQYPF